MLAHQFVPAIGVLTWAVALGMVAGNTGLLPRVAKQALAAVTKRLLRIGIVLLGFAVSFGSIMALGVGTVALVAGTLVTTLVVTTWLGNRMKLGAARSLLIGTGFAICGASAIAAMEDTAGGDEEDVAVGIAMVTLFGTVAMVLLPLLAGPLGLSDMQFGIWAGASIHEVGQVVAAAGAGGAAVVAIAVVVKLTRVLLLAPGRRDGERAQAAGRSGDGRQAAADRAAVRARVPRLRGPAQHRRDPDGGARRDLAGAGRRARRRAVRHGRGGPDPSLFRGSGRVLLVSTLSTLLVTGVALAGVLLLGG